MLVGPVGDRGVGGVEQGLVLGGRGGELGGDGQPGEAGLGVGRRVGQVGQLGRGEQRGDACDLAAVRVDGAGRAVRARPSGSSAASTASRSANGEAATAASRRAVGLVEAVEGERAAGEGVEQLARDARRAARRTRIGVDQPDAVAQLRVRPGRGSQRPGSAARWTGWRRPLLRTRPACGSVAEQLADARRARAAAARRPSAGGDVAAVRCSSVSASSAARVSATGSASSPPAASTRRASCGLGVGAARSAARRSAPRARSTSASAASSWARVTVCSRGSAGAGWSSEPQTGQPCVVVRAVRPARRRCRPGRPRAGR